MHWTIHLENGPQRVNHAAVAIDNKVYSFGGYSSSEGEEVGGFIDTWVLDTDALKWSPLTYSCTGRTVPFRRYGHTVVSYGPKIYLWGGRNDFVASSVLHCFDVCKCTWSLPPTFGQPPEAADGHSACVIDNFMYIFGGFEDNSEKFRRCVYRLNLHTFEWELVETYGTPPVGRDFHTASVIGHRMYIFGGRSSHSEEIMQLPRSEFYCNKIMYLNTKTMKWGMPETLGQVPCGRRSHSAVVYDHELYIFGGYNGNTQNHLKDMHKFDPVRNQWSLVHCSGKGPCPRRRHCACLVSNKLYLFGGSSPYIDTKSDSDTGYYDGYQKLIDHSDLHVLDFFPTLKTLCQLKIIECNLNILVLPKLLMKEIIQMTNDSPNSDHFPRKDYGMFSFSA